MQVNTILKSLVLSKKNHIFKNFYLWFAGEMGKTKQYKNTGDALVTILRQEGVRGIYTG